MSTPSMAKKIMFFTLAILSIEVFIASAIYLISPKKLNPSPPDLAFHCTGEKQNDFQCYKSYLANITTYMNAPTALGELKRLYEVDDYAHTQCHQLSHVIGNTAAHGVADIADAFAYGDNICWSGYYHGVVEEYVQMKGKVGFLAEANDLCAKIPGKNSYSFDYYNCVHGVGHGIMALTHNQLFDALALCDNLKGSWEQRSCYGGVYMENVMADNRNHYAPFLKPDDLLYPCNAVDTKYKEECYKMQTSYALTKNGNSFAGLFALCANAEPAFRRTCALSIGRDASGQHQSVLAPTIAACNETKDDEQLNDCFVGAVRDFVSYYHSDREAHELCTTIPKKFYDNCEAGLQESWRTMAK